jgi:hypothetical protein
VGRRLPPAGSPAARVLLASLIGLAAALGSVAAWRSEEAARTAEDIDRMGIADRVAEQQERAKISAGLQDTFVDYLQAQAALARAAALVNEAARAAAAERDPLLAQAAADHAFARSRLDEIDADAFASGRNSRLDLRRKWEIEYRLSEQRLDLDPRPEFAAADRSRTRSERLVGLTALLIAAALFFTLAQVVRRGPTRLYLGGGLAVMVAAVSLLVAVEASG